MDWITRYAPFLMFGLFVLLAAVVAAAVLPTLIIPLLCAIAVAAVLGLCWRVGK